METFTTIINFLSGLATVVCFGLAVYIFYALWINKKTKTAFLEKHWLLGVFLIALAGMIGSLIYSNVIGYAPCVLCWYQRIALYPLVILFGHALIRKDMSIGKIALPLVMIGGLIAIFHNVLYYADVSIEVCGIGASCFAQYVYLWGFITIPLMSLSLFMAILGLIALGKKSESFPQKN